MDLAQEYETNALLMCVCVLYVSEFSELEAYKVSDKGLYNMLT